MRRQLTIEEFGPNIQHMVGFDNILADMLSRFLYNSVKKYEYSTRKDQCCSDKLFAISGSENSEDSPH